MDCGMSPAPDMIAMIAGCKSVTVLALLSAHDSSVNVTYLCRIAILFRTFSVFPLELEFH